MSGVKEWFTAQELEGLVGLPTTARRVLEMAKREGWKSRKRDKGKGLEYHLSALPEATQIALLRTQAPVAAPAPRPAKATPVIDREGLWNAYEAGTEHERSEAHVRLNTVNLVFGLVANGMGRSKAVEAVAREAGVARATLYNYLKLIQGVDRADWLAALKPAYNKEPRWAECSEEAWEFFKADYLREEEPSVAACYDRLKAAARQHGWTIPSKRAMTRWVTERIPSTVRVLARKGEIALLQRYPALQRSVRELHALHWVNGDGYEHNVFVKWTDGTIVRVKTWYWQDVYSRKILAYRVSLTENTDQIRLSFGDLIEQFGIPEHVTIDNTRAAANKWMTGGAPNRYRFKVKEDDPMGIFTTLGIKVHWTSVNQSGTRAVGHGQAKPVERAFGQGGLGEYVDKHPDFAGAYTGPNVMAKPDNYRSKAVPLDQFERVLNEAIIQWNAREGRRTEMAGGIRSFDQVFNDSYANAPIRKATEAQRRLWLLTAEAVRVGRDGVISLEAGGKVGEGRAGRNRYYAAALVEYGDQGKKVIARFDPDDLHSHVFVYTLDNRFIAKADCIEDAGFGDSQAARIHNSNRREFIKTQKKLAELESRMDIGQVSGLLARPQLPDPVDAKVVRPVRAAMAPPVPVADADLVAQAQAQLASFGQRQAAPEPKSDRELYLEWKALDARINSGEAVSAEDERQWRGFQSTSTYRVQKRMDEEFDLSGAGVARGGDIRAVG